MCQNPINSWLRLIDVIRPIHMWRLFGMKTNTYLGVMFFDAWILTKLSRLEYFIFDDSFYHSLSDLHPAVRTERASLMSLIMGALETVTINNQ